MAALKMQSVKPSVPIMAQIQATTQVMLGTAPAITAMTTPAVPTRPMMIAAIQNIPEREPEMSSLADAAEVSFCLVAAQIEKAMEIYKKYDVTVISDEIWSDIILYGNEHIPTQSVSEDARNRTIALYAPSKTFNLAGLIGSYHIIYNKRLKDRVLKESSLCHYNSMNVLSMHALMGAYTPEGQEWVGELREVIGENVAYACDYIDKHFEGVSVTRPQGTYMLFVNCEEWCKAHDKSLEDVLKMGYEAGVFWQNGKPFHGEWYIRMNLALPTSRVKEAFDRLDKYVFNA